jgi:hypothetical protein
MQEKYFKLKISKLQAPATAPATAGSAQHMSSLPALAAVIHSRCQRIILSLKYFAGSHGGTGVGRRP